MVADRDAAGLTRLGTETTRYGVIDGAAQSGARGEPGLAEVLAAIDDDPAFDGRQVLGDVHPAFPSNTVTLVLEREDGSRATRVLIVGRRRREAHRADADQARRRRARPSTRRPAGR